jgi:hypothetical protein
MSDENLCVRKIMAELKPKRRWFRFSLRALLFFMTVVAIWLSVQLSWIQERRQYLKDNSRASVPPWPGDRIATAPLPLRLFGEQGQTNLRVTLFAPRWITKDRDMTAPEVIEAKRLFPEAAIFIDGDRSRSPFRPRGFVFGN